MNNRLLVLLASLAVPSLFICRPSLSATSDADIAAAEVSVRKADADWAAAARTASVDAWMAFYAADAIVLPPNEPLASSKERVRQTVTALLALPRLSLAWHPIKVAVARSGDLAYLIGAYELRFDDARGAPVSDRGKLLEIWRRQADGSWKCIVDTWNSDGSTAAQAQVEQPASGQGAPPTGPPAQSAPPPPAAVPVSTPPAADSVKGPLTPAQVSASDYGDMPTHYEEAIRQYFQKYLKDPDSVRYQEMTTPQQGYATTITGILAHETRRFGWNVKATINAKNSHGRYVGLKTYTFLFRGENIVHTASPLPEDEMK